MSQPGQKIDWQDLAWEHEFRGDDKEMLDYYYNVEGMTMFEIGQKIEVCATTISKRMKQLGIEIIPKINYNCARGPRLPRGK